MPIAGDAALGKRENFYLIASRFGRKPGDRRQVRRLVSGNMLKLHSGDADVSHASFLPEFRLGFLTGKGAASRGTGRERPHIRVARERCGRRHQSRKTPFAPAPPRTTGG